MALIKSGWLQRQSTILRRWKRNWFDLWSDGSLIFYDDPYRQDMEDRIHMAMDCISIRIGNQCRDLRPPEGKAQDALLQLVCSENKPINICADSPAYAEAWLKVLEDARVNTMLKNPQLYFTEDGMTSPPPPYSEYPPHLQCGYDHCEVYGPPMGTQIVYGPNGKPVAVHYPYQYQGAVAPPGAHCVIVRDRYYDDHGDLALGVLAGAATGMALGSLFSVF